MKEPFKISEFDNQLIVFSINNSRMPEICAILEKKLARKGYDGNVFFDLLACNGLSNRYFNMSFNDGKFQYSTLKKISSPPKLTCEFTNRFYARHFSVIKNSILTSSEKQRITNLIDTNELVTV